jgi:2-oxoglutarate dehydrogenase E2 component (dihydrolipoamide succinyltransferase)
VSLEVKVPRLAESISEATLVEWLRPDGGTVRADEPVATLETDKAAVEIVAEQAGVLTHARKAGDVVRVGDVLGRIAPGAAADGEVAPAGAGPAPAAARAAVPASTVAAAAVPAAAPPAAVPTPAPPAGRAAPAAAGKPAAAPAMLSPSVRRIVEERGLDAAAIAGTGPGGRILKEDALRAAAPQDPDGRVPAPVPAGTPAAGAPVAPPPPAERPDAPDAPPGAPAPAGEAPGDRVVPMSRIRLRIAERLVQAQHTAAILTTFNEIDMTRVMEVRARHREAFERRHGVKLGFMSFFARACVQALADVPAVNAEIRGTDIVYHSAVHLGIAVGAPRGLVVPVVRDAHALDLAGLEREIARMAQRARDAQLTPQELSGGTFTITNGGVYGSLLSTPILNPPQSGILGMHKIEKRPVVLDDAIVVRPMMYVALSYDHRLVDGEQAVTFLVGVKARLEDPERMLLAV